MRKHKKRKIMKYTHSALILLAFFSPIAIAMKGDGIESDGFELVPLWIKKHVTATHSPTTTTTTTITTSTASMTSSLCESSYPTIQSIDELITTTHEKINREYAPNMLATFVAKILPAATISQEDAWRILTTIMPSQQSDQETQN